MKWLTAKVVQYIAGALLIACIGLFARGCALSSSRDVAIADKGTAESARDAAITERDAWKENAKTAVAANVAYDVIFEQQRQEAQAQQRRADEAAQQAAAVVAQSRRDEAVAEKKLADFRAKFAGKSMPCAAALLAMQNACPALEGY